MNKTACKKDFCFHIVPHTHWDREWYLTFEQFRIRLVEMIDFLLEVLDRESELKFMLDGQTVVLEDYLEIRTESKERLKKYVKEGRILIGPWYVLSDECLVSGEALVRNLLLGHRIAREFGHVMKVGYIPDIFGHISQLPQILNGFDIDNFVAFRGIESKKTEFWWEAPDGTRVLAILLPDSYCNFHTFPEDPHTAVKEIAVAKKSLAPRATTNNLLLMNGCDHRRPQPQLPKMIKEVNKLLKDDSLILSTLPEYIEKIKQAGTELKTYCGEQRTPVYRYVHSSGVLATRIHLKQENVATETLLEKWVEPFSAFSWILNKTYPQCLILQAWKYLLQNQPHDSICGCSIDEVHREMMMRFSKAQQIGEEILQRSFRGIAEKIDTSELAEDETALVVFNPLNWTRTGIVKTRLEFPAKEIKTFALKDGQKNEIYCEIEYCGRESTIVPSPNGASPVVPQMTDMDRWELVFSASDVPACGCKKYSLKRAARHGKEKAGFESMVKEKNTLENKYLKVIIEDNGSLSVVDKETGVIYAGLHIFEDGGDCGDLFDYSPPFKDKIITTSESKARISLISNGPLLATYKVELDLKLPQSLTADRKRRSFSMRTCPATSCITLCSGSKKVDIITEVDNLVKDHRLRVLFSSGMKADFSYADSQFEVTKRSVIAPNKDDYKWEPYGLHPQQSFVDVNNSEKGLTIANIGLPQYQVKDDNEGTIALTLIRSVGWFRQEGLAGVKREKGEKRMPTLEAQCSGKYIFHYAIIPHKGTWQSAKTYKEAYEHKTPLRAIVTDRHDGQLKDDLSFLSIQPDTLIISAIKKAEDSNSLVVRCYNPANRETEGKLKVCKPIRRAYLVNLNEEVIQPLRIEKKNTLSMKVGSNKIITVLITLEG